LTDNAYDLQKKAKKEKIAIHEALHADMIENVDNSGGVKIILVKNLKYDALYMADTRTVLISAELEYQKKLKIMSFFRK